MHFRMRFQMHCRRVTEHNVNLTEQGPCRYGAFHDIACRQKDAKFLHFGETLFGYHCADLFDLFVRRGSIGR